MPISIRQIAAILLSAFIFGLGVGAVSAPKSGRAADAEPLSQATESPRAMLGTPSEEPTDHTSPSPAASPRKTSTPTATPTVTTPPPTTPVATPPATTGPPPPAGAYALSAAADKSSVAPYESVTIRGQLSPAQSGVTLVVQRLVNGAWSDFPASTTTSSTGSYKVSVSSGQSGENVFRVTWREQNVVSNEVRIATT